MRINFISAMTQNDNVGTRHGVSYNDVVSLRLNHTTVDLSGMNLIEASAGTGKTYAIASLYLRLLLEKELLPEEILVVTYTEAATQELRSRIRNRIREALEVMEGREEGDPFLQELCRKYGGGELQREREILERALSAFDTASIFTIHGFCLRALQDNAFESGSLYDTELVTDQSKLLGEIVDDFWRMHFFREPAPFLGYALRKRYSPASFMAFLKSLHTGTGSLIIPSFSVEEIAALEKECSAAYEEIGRMWQDEKNAITQLLLNDKGLKRSADTYRFDLLEALFSGMDAFVEGGNPYDLFEGFEKFTTSVIRDGTKQKNSPPQHPFFESCEQLHDAAGQRFLALQAELVSFYQKKLPLRKRSGNIRFFDDLLEDLYHALVSESGGDILADLLRQKYHAALIDEFQDTDPVQYEIFRRIYAGSYLPLFLIGDPKQAIYSFRGADIFAYMRAAREVKEEKRFTLTENWRSDPLLLHAFNTLFENSKQPFLYDQIAYHPLMPGNREAQGDQSDDADKPPLQIWLMDSGDKKNGVLTVDEANSLASEGVSGEIERLLLEGLKGDILSGDRPLAAGDIAVIVRTHRQAALVLNALRARGIAGVMRSDMSVFASREAEELRILLSAIVDPGSERKIRVALVTDILGRSGNDIASLSEDETSWSKCLREFSFYHHLLLERGVIVMSRELMAREGVRGRLLASPDNSGERRLTNLLHCFELLHRQEHERGLGMEGLVSWFSEQLGKEEQAEEYQIRLETDEAAVKILTVHVSKGLEYPVVFCPFLWGGSGGGGKVLTFHNDEWQLVHDFGSGEFLRHRSIAEKESLAENLRLLYVALTRAKYRCYLFSGKTRSDSSPINYLLHASDEARRAQNQSTALAEEAKLLTADRMASELQSLAGSSEGSIGFQMVTHGALESETPLFGSSTVKSEELLLRSFSGIVDTGWRVSSFTSFSRHEQKHVELPDRDEPQALSEQPLSTAGEKSIFSFPRGAQAGIFMHGIFEELSFNSPSEDEVRNLVEKGLERYDYGLEWQSVLSSMVQNVITTPLASPEGEFMLGGLKKGSWITELEFFFPLRFVTPSILGEVLARHGVIPGGVDLALLAEVLQFRPVKGMLMGFMDMVFEVKGRYYLLDWKSNHLGNTLEDYGPEKMKKAMDTNLYPLQYLLYSVALNRYLSLRIERYSYSKHFGGVIYVFLRGVSQNSGEKTGFFRDRPDDGLIRELTNILIEQGG